MFEIKIGEIIDHHTPEVVKLRTTRTRFPWYNNSIKDERQVCRRLERKWPKTGSDEDKQSYIDQRNKVNKLVGSAKTDSDIKGVFPTVKTLLNQNTQILPSSETTYDLCAKFASFFNDKVQKIRDSLDENEQCVDTQSRPVDILENHVNHVNHVLSDFN